MHKRLRSQHTQVLVALGLQSLVAIALFFADALRNDSYIYWYLIWNLFLAWLPLVFAYSLHIYLKKHLWGTWSGLILTALWLGFLPNSFYMVSDLVHIASTVRIDLLLDVITLVAFSICGLVLGFLSIYLIHRELIKRVKLNSAHLTIAVVILLCGFAIYMGRYLRWNSWDILINPAGILFAVSDPIVDPRLHPDAFSTTFGFFALLGSIYIVIWQFIKSLLRSQPS